MATAENYYSLSTLFYLGACSLIPVHLVLSTLGRFGKSTTPKLIMAILTFFGCFYPFLNLMVNEYIRGYLGDLSVSSIMMLGISISNRLMDKRLSLPEKTTAFQLIFWSGLFVYPFTLGWDIYNPYATGYEPTGLGIILLITVIFSWVLEYYLIMSGILLGITFYTLGIGGSANLWNFLIDPLIFGISAFWLLHRLVFFRSQQPAQGTTHENQSH